MCGVSLCWEVSARKKLVACGTDREEAVGVTVLTWWDLDQEGMHGQYGWSGVGGAEGDRTPDLRAASAGSTCSWGFAEACGWCSASA